MQHSDSISSPLGEARVKLQEDRTTFVVGPAPKQLPTSFSAVTMDNIYPEIAPHFNPRHIQKLLWTNQSLQNMTEGHVRVLVLTSKASAFPTYLWLFGRPVLVNRIKREVSIPVCKRCYGYHQTRTCARPLRCSSCGKLRHEGACKAPNRCLNCRDPHKSDSTDCIARPKVERGTYVRLTYSQRKAARNIGSTS